MGQWIIIYTNGHEYRNGGEVFDTQSDAECWIDNYVDEDEQDDVTVMEVL